MLLQADTQRDPMALRDRFTKQRMSEAMSCYPRAMREFFRNDGLDGAAFAFLLYGACNVPRTLGINISAVTSGSQREQYSVDVGFVATEPRHERTTN